MKLSETQLEHLSRMIRSDFDNIPTRYRSDVHRHDVSMELIELAEEMRSDLRSEESDPNEDRNNDTDYNNERESNFKNAFK